MSGITDVQLVWQSLSYVKDTLSFLVKGKVEIESQTKIMEALEQLGEAQDALFHMRERMFELQNTPLLF